jgi:hypothetical protein
MVFRNMVMFYGEELLAQKMAVRWYKSLRRLVEPEYSLPCLLQSATRLYPTLEEYTPRPYAPFSYDLF